MSEDDAFIPVYDEDNHIIAIKDNRYDLLPREINDMKRVIELLNEQDSIIKMWVKHGNRIDKLLEENTKPTTYDKGDVYLSIGEDKQCRYEKTFICSKCAYYSNYFADCRLMMEDKQYQKAIKLGLIKEEED